MRFWLAVGAVLAVVCGAMAVSAETIELRTGEKLEGVILEQDDEKVVLQHLVLGRIEIPKADIKEPEEEVEKPGLFGTPILRGWNKSLSAGINGSTGKSEEVSANAQLNLNRETERHRMQYIGTYVVSRTEGSTGEHFFDTRYVHDLLFPPTNWFPFVTASYRWDTKQDWEHRVGGQAGVGYQFLDTDEWNLIGRVGSGVSQTIGDERSEPKSGDAPTRTEPNVLAAIQMAWNYTEGQSLTAATLYLLDAGDAPEYRSESRGEWKIAVGLVEGLGFKAGVAYIYDSHEEGSNKKDFRYYGNIVYDF